MFWRLAAWDRPVLSCSEDHCDFSTVCLPTHCFASHYVIFIVRACTLQFGGICHRTWSSILVNIIIFLSLYVTTHDPHFLSILLLLLFVIICQRTRSSIFVIIIIVIICHYLSAHMVLIRRPRWWKFFFTAYHPGRGIFFCNSLIFFSAHDPH